MTVTVQQDSREECRKLNLAIDDGSYREQRGSLDAARQALSWAHRPRECRFALHGGYAGHSGRARRLSG